MTCDALQVQMTAWQDGELPPQTAAEMEAHLASCADCVETLAKFATVHEMADGWVVPTPDLTERILHAVNEDDPSILLDELRALHGEMQALRAEVSDLRRQLSHRDDPPAWFPPAKPDYSRLENDPWNLTRS